MADEVDINSIAAEFVSLRIDSFWNSIKSTIQEVAERVKIQAMLEHYITCTVQKHSRARSFFYRSDPVDLYSFYVPVGVTKDHQPIPRVTAESLFKNNKRVVIQGSGGCGKTVLSRHLLMDLLRSTTRIPVFVELRELNTANLTISALIQQTLASSGLSLTPENFKRTLEKGIYCFLFDGYDELALSIRKTTGLGIKQLVDAHPDNWVVITTRPDNEFADWQGFSIFTVLPLSIEQALELVTKTPMADELKSRFAEDLKDRLYVRHKSFLSNPLLLSIMLLTYYDAADIPTKLSVFYSQAYEALFQRHDAWKGGYKRNRLTSLDIHDFAKLFAAFSIISYSRRAFVFSHSEAIEFAKKGIERTGLKVVPEAFIEDCKQAVCLLVEDGLKLSYSHRSFQEYFSARCIAEAPPGIKEKLLEHVSHNFARDSVLGLLHEMQPDFVEVHFLLPRLKHVVSVFRAPHEQVSRAAHLRYIQSAFEKIYISPAEKRILASAKPDDGGIDEIMWYVVTNCAYLSKAERPPKTSRHDEIFWKQYTGSSGESIKTSRLTTKHPVMVHLYDRSTWLGGWAVTVALDALREIELKARRAAAPDIDEILGLKS